MTPIGMLPKLSNRSGAVKASAHAEAALELLAPARGKGAAGDSSAGMVCLVVAGGASCEIRSADQVGLVRG